MGSMSCIDASTNSFPFFVPGALVHWFCGHFMLSQLAWASSCPALALLVCLMAQPRAVTTNPDKPLLFVCSFSPFLASSHGASENIPQLELPPHQRVPLARWWGAAGAPHSLPPLHGATAGLSSWLLGQQDTAATPPTASCVTALGVGWLPALPAQLTSRL